MQINPELEAAAVTWQSLLDEAAPAAPAKIPTAKARKEALRQMIEVVDLDKFVHIQDQMTSVLDQILANAINAESEEICTDAELAAYMQEYLDSQELKDLFELRYQMIRARIFAHMTAVDGVGPTEIPMPAFDKKFTREGGKTRFGLDESEAGRDKLAHLLGPERWARIIKQTVVTTYSLDHDAIVKLVNEDPAVMEILRACVIPTPPTKTSFHVRNITQD